MKRLLLLFLIGGCTTQAVIDEQAGRTTVASSPLGAGIYFGTTVCEFEDSVNGQVVRTRAEELDYPLVISESGIPLRNGVEEYVGRTDQQTFSGITFTSTVVGVSAFPSGVNIIIVGGATVRDGDAVAELLFRQEDVYTPLRNSQVQVTSNVFVSVFSGTTNISADGICRTTFSQ